MFKIFGINVTDKVEDVVADMEVNNPERSPQYYRKAMIEALLQVPGITNKVAWAPELMRTAQFFEDYELPPAEAGVSKTTSLLPPPVNALRLEPSPDLCNILRAAFTSRSKTNPQSSHM